MEEKRERKGTIWIVLSILFLIGILVIGYLYFDSRTNMNNRITEKVQENLQLNQDLDSIVNIFEETTRAYGVLNDSLHDLRDVITTQQDRIKLLIAENRGKREIERELALLQSKIQMYEHKLDSIFLQNQKLTDENLKLSHLFESEQKRTYELTVEKEELTKKATLGAVVKAYNVTAKTYRVRGTGKEVETDKARRVDRIKICFTIGENLVISPGKKNIYIRIARPDNVVLKMGKEETNSFEYNGKSIVYSMKEIVDYQNKAHNMCVNWDKIVDGSAMKGTYQVAVFMESEQIGTTSFTLN